MDLTPARPACGGNHPAQYKILVDRDDDGTEYWADAICTEHQKHIPCRTCAWERGPRGRVVKRRSVEGDEQDAFSRWRYVTRWRSGELHRIKRKANKRERQEAKREAAETAAWRHTAEVLADPDLTATLTKDGEDLGPVPEPQSLQRGLADAAEGRIRPLDWPTAEDET